MKITPPLHGIEQGGFEPISSCCCQRRHDAPPIPFTIFLMRNQLLYDIDAQTHLVSRSRRDNGINQVTSSSDETDTYRPLMNRWIDKYIALAKSRLQAYVLEPKRGSGMDVLKEKTEDEIKLMMPGYWDDSVTEQLITATHDYVVNGVLYEFFSLTLTAKDPVTMSKYDAMMESYNQMKIYANTIKPNSVRKPLQPF